MRAVQRDYPDISREKAEKVRDVMNAHVRACLVTNYEELIPALTLPDPDDRHVLAAAIHAGADVIVTINLGDFPAATLKAYGIEAQHPDDSIIHLLDLAPGTVCGAVKRQRGSLRNPPKSADELLATVERQGLAQNRRPASRFHRPALIVTVTSKNRPDGNSSLPDHGLSTLIH
jgi:PIN domain-containing protein